MIFRNKYKVVHRKQFNSKTFQKPTKCHIEIKNEYDLHSRVEKFLRKKYPDLILIVGLGELQDTSSKRISAYNKGYKGGQPDLTLVHSNKQYNGMAIEFKNPNGTGRLSSKQESFLMDMHSQCD